MDPIKQKIVKLLNLANDKGASEDEAATAMRMAMGLMAKHGIEQSQLGNGLTPPRAKLGTFIRDKFKPYQVTLASAAATLYGCRIVCFGKGGCAGIQFVGRPDNIEAAEMTSLWLARQVEAIYKASLPKGLDKRTRAEYRATFKDACANRVSSRALRLMLDLTHNQANALGATGQNALVVQGYFDQCFKEADEAMRAEFPNIKEGAERKFKYGIGTAAGREAGDRVQLRQEVK
jgi:hypothetical protein